MVEAVIDSLPSDLRQQLEMRARSNRRSPAEEAVAILEAILRAEKRSMEQVLRGLPLRGAKPLTDELIEEAKATGRP